jgi:hypothetical protein
VEIVGPEPWVCAAMAHTTAATITRFRFAIMLIFQPVADL